MGFFQNSVLNKHLKSLDKAVLNAAYAKFKEYFYNPEIQHNIREAKEEQFQEGFLRELFVKVLGYTLNPQPNYNITTELKNEKGAKKADGAILQNGKAIAVIELKGTDTKDLDKINTQAFNYKNNQTGCIYVITSNFEKLRFFINNSVDHLEFNLFTLTEQEFELLWLCLNVDCLLGGIPLKVKEESLLAEENVTKQLYKDYAAFRINLWQNMVKNRPDTDQLLLFKKTQKLLDRFLFIFFAEDSGLLPPNSISRIVKRWNVLQEEDAYKPLYDIFNQYFGYINTGRKGKIPQDDIFAYDGGLFFSDEVLDNIVIDDDVLQPHVMKLTAYDFQSEIDVNILGHIFENSLSEIENVIAKLEGKEVDKNKTKRKKEGVFYTPKYITKYIVNNTIGKLCEEKKAEDGIVDEEYAKGRRNRKKETIRKLDKGLQAYRKWLLNITICDPACGSGAFLNQALEYLIAEHAYIDELQAQLLGRSIVFQDVSNHILEKNIYGVDINEESVDIAKLSLWLRTAQKGRKLTFLNNNLKCGNSLIDDPKVAGEKAFNWQKEFPEIFSKGGFDVVIGNPPYVRVQNLNYETIDWLKGNKESAYKRVDISILFIEEALKLINECGVISFITSNQFFKAEYGRKLRKIIKGKLHSNIDFSDVSVFEGLSTYVSILSLANQTVNKLDYAKISNAQLGIENLKLHSFNYEDYSDDAWDFNLNKGLKDKIYQGSNLLAECADFVYGIITGNDDAFIVTREEAEKNNFEKGVLFDFIKPENYKKYAIKKPDKIIIYPYNEFNEVFLEHDFKNLFPGVYKHLIEHKEILENRKDSRITIKEKGLDWYSIMRRVHPKDIKATKIIFYDVGGSPNFCLDEKGIAFGGGTSHSFTVKDGSDYSLEYLLALLNSKVLSWVILGICPVKMGGARKYGLDYMRKLPIRKIDKNEQNLYVQLARNLIKLNKKFIDIVSQFTVLLQSKFGIKKMNKKLQVWYELNFMEFLKELKKIKITITLAEEAEWIQYFGEQKQNALELKTEIDRIDNEIDQMVYELYGLTKEEIEIIENTK